MNTPDFMPRLARGSHREPQQGACVMEYISFITGDEFSDKPKCTPLTLTYLAQLVNDMIQVDSERSRLMVPLMPRLVGLGHDAEVDEAIMNFLAEKAKANLANFPGMTFAHVDDLCGQNDAGYMAWAAIGRSGETWNAIYVKPAYDLLVECLDLYDTLVGRDKTENLTPEQTGLVLQVHEIVTAGR